MTGHRNAPYLGLAHTRFGQFRLRKRLPATAAALKAGDHLHGPDRIGDVAVVRATSQGHRHAHFTR